MSNHTSQVFYGHPSFKDEIKEIENITYEDFLSFKAKFMKTMKFQWLIQGHLDKEQALELCDIARNSVSFKDMDEDDMLQFNLMVKLPDRTVFNYEKVNESPEGQNQKPNPNSAIQVYF